MTKKHKDELKEDAFYAISYQKSSIILHKFFTIVTFA